MGFADARKRLIAALESRNYTHEARDALAEKNLLAIGDVTEEEVVRMLQRARGDQYSTSLHVWDAEIRVHVFRPELDGERWYVKAYLLDSKVDAAVFISVHR